MVRKHKGRDHSALDANIIEFLMLADSNPTASTIAQGIGMQRASDVAQRLNALFEKGIISKAKLGKRVFWSIVSDADSPSSDDSIALINTPAVDNHCALETDDHTPSATAEANKGSAVSDSDYAAKLIDTLFGTIEHLKSEVAFLREEVKIRDAQLSSVLTQNATPICFDADTPYPTVHADLCSEANSSPPGTPLRSWAPDPIATSNRFELLSVADVDSPSKSSVVDVEASDADVDAVVQLSVRSGRPTYDASPAQEFVGVEDMSIRPSASPSPLSAPADTYANVTIRTRHQRKQPHIPHGDDDDSGTDVTMTPPASPAPSHSNDRDKLVSTVPSSSDAAKPAETSSSCDPLNIRPRVRMKKPLVAVVGDSMIKRMSSYDLHNLLGDDINAFVRPFVGATIEEMMSYIDPILQKKPDVIVLHIGTNDLSNAPSNGEQSVLSGLHDLIAKIGDVLPSVIIVLSFPTCRRDSYNGRVRLYNNMLLEYCRKNLICFFSNDNINFNHLNKGGLHLNIEGSRILSENITCFINFIVSHCFPY